ncbi:glycosyltransferase [Pseudomonas sp. DNDY-54]|uniref:glycosyltransferase n=1 Tax=Pseudomonas sp. DNDY-54 TaxID=2870860 RepID=UPI001CA41BFB|nr:glycosyltransferase [Pseudomonas sp. DNDY-54]
MHILIIPSWYPKYPGDLSGCFFREQALALKKNDCKIGVIFPQLRSVKDWRKVLQGEYGLTVEDDYGLPTYRSHGISWFPRIARIGAWLWIKHGKYLYNEYVKEHGRPDVIHAHSAIYGGCLAFELSTQHGIPYIITEHSTAYARNRISGDLKTLCSAAIAQANYRIAVSKEFSQLLEGFYNLAHANWNYIANIVNSKFSERPLESQGKGKFTFINVASLTKKKSLDILIRAFNVASKENNDIALKIGGDGPEKVKLEQLAISLGINDKVTFLGKLTRDQVVEEMAKSDAFALSSKFETFGVVVIEALALGKPVIATRCGGPESIVRKQDGILVSTDDVVGLAAAMNEIYNNRELYDHHEIRQSCVARFGEKAIAQQLKSVYATVISKS